MKSKLSMTVLLLVITLIPNYLLAIPIQNYFTPTLPVGEIKLSQIYKDVNFGVDKHTIKEGVQFIQDTVDGTPFFIDVEGIQMPKLKANTNKTYKSHWSYNSLNYASQLGMLSHDDVINYNPNEKITLFQFIDGVNKVFMLTNKYGYLNDRKLTLTKLDRLSKNSVGFHTIASITTKLSPSGFSIIQNNLDSLTTTTITRDTMCIILDDLMSEYYPPKPIHVVRFQDMKVVPDYISNIVNLNILSGDYNRNFNPEDELTMAQYVTVLERLYKIIISEVE